jgi:hypothetical protein
VLLISTAFIPLARSQSRILGMPALPVTVLPHPIAGTPIEAVLAKVDAAFDEIVAHLTAPLADESASAGRSVAQDALLDIAATDEWTDLQQAFVDRGWSDGLPCVPPTEPRVAAMQRHAGMPPDHVLGAVPPRMGAATLEKIAANAVMAGCRPEHLPIVLAAVDAMLAPAFNLYGLQTTTHCVAPLLVVNGPLAGALKVHAGNNLFGPGPWANGVIGRAIRLVLLNLGGGKPGDIDKATMGHPGKYTFCIAENEAVSPWPGLRADRGFGAEVSTVTVIGGEAPHNINDHESTTARGVLKMITGTMAQTGQNNVYYAGEPLLILCPEHAATIASEGLSKDDVKRILYEEARVPLDRFSAENIERRMLRKFPERYKDRPLDTPVTVAQCWEDMMVIVAGGPGKHSMYVPTFGGTRSVTRAVLHPDGQPWLASELGA